MRCSLVLALCSSADAYNLLNFVRLKPKPPSGAAVPVGDLKDLKGKVVPVDIKRFRLLRLPNRATLQPPPVPPAPPPLIVKDSVLLATVGGASYELLRGLPSSLQVAAADDRGLFFDFDGAKNRSEHTVSLGQLSCERLLAAARTKRWWMGPSWGAGAADVPGETQFLLLELGPNAYALMLPLVSGAFRASLRGRQRGGALAAQLQSGDPDVRTRRVPNALFVAAGDDPYALIERGMAAAAERLGTFEVAARKRTPPELDNFGWCTWDAFYSAVDPAGVSAGLQSLQAGGTPARTLILDDGWQSVAQEGPRAYKPKAAAAEGEASGAADGVRVHKRERARREAAADAELEPPPPAGFEWGVGGDGTARAAAAAAAEAVEDEEEVHFNNPADMVGSNPLQDAVSEWYRTAVHAAPLDSLTVRLFRLLAHTLARPALEQMFDEQTDFSKRLFSFTANAKFEDAAAHTSLRGAVAEWKERYGLRRVYAWHTIGGYWGGVSSVAPQMAHLRPSDVKPSPTRSLLEVEPALGWDAAALFGVGTVHPQRLLSFYHGLHGYLAAAGVDGVKVDGQSGLTAFGRGAGGSAAGVRAHTHAMEASVAEHFEQNRCINCMCHSSENLYAFRQTAVLRAADDFYPDDAASQPVHLANVAYNSLFLSALGTPDWDMFQSAHPDAGMHAAARAVGGSPVYVSDAPGAHDLPLLRKLVLPDGSTLRCPTAGRPTRDCLFADPNTDGASALKVWNRNGVTGVLAAFNVQGARWSRERRAFEEEQPRMVGVTAALRAADVEGLAAAAAARRAAAAAAEVAEGCAVDADAVGAAAEACSEWVLFGHQAQQPVALRDAAAAHELSLAPRAWEVFTVAAVERRAAVAWAPLGLVRMLNGGGAVVSSELRRRGLFGGAVAARVELRATGEFGAYCRPRPRSVRVDGKPAPFTHDEHGLLRVELPVSAEAAEVWVQFAD